MLLGGQQKGHPTYNKKA